jgi:thiamine kinase-like enzyme
MQSVPSLSVPVDDALPGAAILLDVDQMRPKVQQTFGTIGLIARLQIRYTDYVPGVSLRVHYRAEVGTVRYDLVAQTGHLLPASAEIDRLKTVCKERIRARLPITRHADADAYLMWYPIDFGLPMLTRSDTELADLVGFDSAGPTTRIAWKPGRRAVLRYPNAVMKVYGNPDDARKAVLAMKTVQDHVPTAKLISADRDNGLVMQQLLPGVSLAKADTLSSMHRTMEILKQLHSLDPLEIDPDAKIGAYRPADLLADIAGPAGLVSFVLPDLASRIQNIVSKLTNMMPHDLAMVPSHGDFHIEQFLQHGESLNLLDFDTLCLGPRAFDVASYATNVVVGHADDVDNARALLVEIGEQYRESSEGLQWYCAAMVMKRVDRAIRRFKRDWSDRTGELVSAAEQLLP